jgi:hypothetical protein
MDVATVKMPVVNPEEEKTPSAAPESDPAFLQLLAGLGSAAQIPVEARRSSRENSGAPVQGESLSERGQFADASAIALLQTVQAGQGGLKLEELPENAQRPAGNTEHIPAATVSAQRMGTNTTNMTAARQAMTIDAKPSEGIAPALEIQIAAQSLDIRSKDQTQPVPINVMDVISSSPAPKERGSASGGASAIGFMSNAGLQSSVAGEASAKPMSATMQAVAWGAVMESSGGPDAGRENHSASGEHEGWKERGPQGEAASSPFSPSTSIGPPAATSVASQSPAISTRAVPDAIEAPRGTATLESPLPASVRFEVQPGDMGRIRVHLSIVDHTVYTNVTTERVDTHDFLVKGSERYEAGLAAHGLDIGRFQVDVQAQAREHADRGTAGWSQEQSQRYRADPSSHLAVERHADERPRPLPIEWDDRTVNLFA